MTIPAATVEYLARDADDPSCERCDQIYHLRANHEQTRYCDLCAHIMVEVERQRADAAGQRCLELSIQRVRTHGAAHCLYCGYTGERKLFAEAKAETLEHGRTCEKHPMRSIEQQNKILLNIAVDAERERDELHEVIEVIRREHSRAVAMLTDSDNLYRETARERDELRKLLEPSAPVAVNEELADRFRAEIEKSEDGKPDGTVESLAQCTRTIDTYFRDLFPANEKGQIHFARSIMESVASEIRAYLSNINAALAKGVG